MIAKLLPALVALVGLGAGVGAGLALRPDPAEAEIADQAIQPCGPGLESEEPDETTPAAATQGEDEHATGATDFVQIDNQFVIPVIEDQRVAAMVVLSLTLEVAAGQTDGTLARMPKLRDRFLRAMLDHANVGGFSGTFTSGGSVEQLRRNLVEVGRKELGGVLTDVLILDLNRQTV